MAGARSCYSSWFHRVGWSVVGDRVLWTCEFLDRISAESVVGYFYVVRVLDPDILVYDMYV